MKAAFLSIVKRIYRPLYRVSSRLYWLYVRPIAYGYFFIEYVLFLFAHRSALRDADHVFPLWFWSFGHQAVDPHMLALRFRGKKLLVLVSDYRNYNPHIVSSFEHLVSMVTFHHTSLGRWCALHLGVPSLTRLKRSALRLVCRCMGKHVEIVDTFYGEGSEPITGVFMPTYIRLLREHSADIGIPPSHAIDAFSDALHTEWPESDGKFCVSLYLRRKRSTMLDVRDTDSAAYRDSIKVITDAGGFVLLGGDYDRRDAYPDLEGVRSHHEFRSERALFDLYALTQCRFHVCGHSGSLSVATAFGIPTLITNCGFFYLSAYTADQFLIYKSVRDVRTGHILSPLETFSSRVISCTDAAHFKAAGLEVIDNEPGVLARATQDMIEAYVQSRDLAYDADDRAMEERWRSLLHPSSAAALSPARPARAYLRSLNR